MHIFHTVCKHYNNTVFAFNYEDWTLQRSRVTVHNTSNVMACATGNERAESGFTEFDVDRRELPLPKAADSGGAVVDLEERAEELGIRYFLVSYTTLNSDSRVSVVPKRAIAGVQRRGCGVPAAMYFKADGADPEMNVVPDPTTLIQLPWKPEYAWLARSVLYISFVSVVFSQ